MVATPTTVAPASRTARTAASGDAPVSTGIDLSTLLPGDVSWTAIMTASVFGFLSWAGFESGASLGEETKDPKRTVPRALTYAGESQSEVLSAFVTEYDLSTGKQRGRVELDVVMRLDRPGFFSFGLGGGWTLYRSYVLGPRGLFAGKLEKTPSR